MTPSPAAVATAALLCILLCARTTLSSLPNNDSDCGALVTDKAARAFLQERAMQPGSVLACEAVEHLGLGGGAFKGGDVQLFVPALLRMHALRTLDLSHMSIDSDDLQALAPVFTELSGLQRLSLNGNPIGQSGAAILATSITSSSIEWLQLEHTQIGAEGLTLLKPLLMRQSSTLTWLNLENCDLGPEGAVSLAGVIGSFQQLHELNIARNRVGDSGCGELLGAMQWGEVRKLWLGSNALTGAALHHMQTQGENLQLLDLTANALSPNCSDALVGALKRMPNLRTLLLGGNLQLSDAGATAVASLFKSLPSLSHAALDGLHLSQEAHAAMAGKQSLFSFCCIVLCLPVCLTLWG